jgi:hypothetical protein
VEWEEAIHRIHRTEDGDLINVCRCILTHYFYILEYMKLKNSQYNLAEKSLIKEVVLYIKSLVFRVVLFDVILDDLLLEFML